MKFLVLIAITIFSFTAVSQVEEYTVKSNIRLVIYEGDQYQKWYGAFHEKDLNMPDSLLSYTNKKLEKKRSKARKKEKKAVVFHEVIIPIEIKFSLNSDSIPVPYISECVVTSYADSLISFDISNLKFDNKSLISGNGYSSFQFDIDITNNHIAMSDNRSNPSIMRMVFSGTVSYSDGKKSSHNVGYSGSVYSRGERTIYKVDGKKYSFIPFVYRSEYDFEEKFSSFPY